MFDCNAYVHVLVNKPMIRIKKQEKIILLLFLFR